MKPLARPLLWSLVVALFVTVSCEEIKLNGFTKCVNLPKPPSDVVNTDGKSVQYDSCAVKIKDYDKVIGKYEKQRRELETGISKSNDKTAREKMQKELKSDYFFKIGLYTLVGFAVATFLSLTALIFNWYTLFWVTFRIRRRLCSLNEKMVIAEKMLARRRFADELIEKLSRVAEFDVNINEEEITKKLNSVYQATGPDAAGKSL